MLEHLAVLVLLLNLCLNCQLLFINHVLQLLHRDLRGLPPGYPNLFLIISSYSLLLLLYREGLRYLLLLINLNGLVAALSTLLGCILRDTACTRSWLRMLLLGVVVLNINSSQRHGLLLTVNSNCYLLDFLVLDNRNFTPFWFLLFTFTLIQSIIENSFIVFLLLFFKNLFCCHVVAV